MTIKNSLSLTMVLNDKGKEALNEKLNYPDKEVRCPRCGNEIVYEERGNPIAVKCKTPSFIYGGIRGL